MTRRAGGGGRVTAKKPRYHIDCPSCGGHVPAELCDCEAGQHLVLKKHDCPHCGEVLCADCRREKGLDEQFDTMTTSLRTHDHATLAEAGQCPSCRQEVIDMLSDVPADCWLLSYPDTEQVALVRSFEPPPDGPVEVAWATGCNTGGAVTFERLDRATIEASGVECFVLIAGDDVGRALAALGISGRPWDDLSRYGPCPHCGGEGHLPGEHRHT